MEEYYTLSITVIKQRHPEGQPLHNNRTDTEVASIKLKGENLNVVLARAGSHLELIEE